MKDFEQIMRNKLEQATAKDIVPFYNKDDDWQRLSADLPAHKKTRGLLWLPYAAALLFIIGAGFYFLNAKHTINNQVAVSQEPVIRTIIVHDTVMVTAKEKPFGMATPKATPVIVYHDRKKLPVPVRTPIQSASNLVHNDVQPAKAPDVAIAVAEPVHRKHAVHVMDINNEDTRMLVRQTHYVRRDNIITYLFPVRQPNTNNQIVTSPTIIDLFRP